MGSGWSGRLWVGGRAGSPGSVVNLPVWEISDNQNWWLKRIKAGLADHSTTEIKKVISHSQHSCSTGRRIRVSARPRDSLDLPRGLTRSVSAECGAWHSLHGLGTLSARPSRPVQHTMSWTTGDTPNLRSGRHNLTLLWPSSPGRA